MSSSWSRRANANRSPAGAIDGNSALTPASLDALRGMRAVHGHAPQVVDLELVSIALKITDVPSLVQARPL